jgi:alkanesulfonate monooxygenase SsuD/methylene tetrahydromethanopterin reductase-like flavin-dependent oxidoreductase (luciferase family)
MMILAIAPRSDKERRGGNVCGQFDLLLMLNEGERVTWRGRFRAPLSNSEISPQPVGKLPIWLGVGGNPESALRAGDLGLSLSLKHYPAAGQLWSP